MPEGEKAPIQGRDEAMNELNLIIDGMVKVPPAIRAELSEKILSWIEDRLTQAFVGALAVEFANMKEYQDQIKELLNRPVDSKHGAN